MTAFFSKKKIYIYISYKPYFFMKLGCKADSLLFQLTLTCLPEHFGKCIWVRMLRCEGRDARKTMTLSYCSICDAFKSAKLPEICLAQVLSRFISGKYVV